ncbi:MAG: ABC transporter permease subunit [Anaerolineae bacterium]
MVNILYMTLKWVEDKGWRSGFGNLFQKENNQWWKTRRWWLHLLLWTILINGMLTFVIWQEKPDNAAMSAGNNTFLDATDPMAGPLFVFIVTVGIVTAVGITIVMQDIVVGEKQAGTAAWILSKPVARPAFILAKLAANTLNGLGIMIVLQCVLAYIQMLVAGSVPSTVSWLYGTSLLALHVLFYLTLTLMLGTLFSARTVIVGIPLLILFAAQIVPYILPQIGLVMPWALVHPIDGSLPLALAAMRGDALWSVVPIFTTALLSATFIYVALQRFKQEEF